MTSNNTMTTNVKAPASTTATTPVKSPASVMVVMDDDGAEIVMHETSNRAETWKSCTKSLLDEDTPTQKNLVVRTPSSVVDAAGLCCAKLEDAIDALLSKPTGSLSNDWQLWSYFGTSGETEVKNVNQTIKDDARKVLRKRLFFSANERKTRMDAVRKDLSPFTMTPTRPHRVPNKLGTVKSFDLILDHRKRNIPETKSTKNHTNISSLVSMCGACHVDEKVAADSPAVIRSSMLDAIHEDDCYDSDPEDFTRRRLFRENSTSTGDKENLKSNHGINLYQYPVDSEEFIFNSVQEFINERFTLILHTAREEGKPTTSYAVKAWFERGQHLSSNKVIQPRFLWHKKEKPTTRRPVALPNAKNVSGFDLVDVARVLAVDSIDRKLYPFASAKPAACFLIKTWEDSRDQRCWLFEAASKSERERIVRWMKLAVARLASKLIVGDNSLFEEFFHTTMPDSAPGEEPNLFLN